MLYDAIQGSNGFYNSPVDPGEKALLSLPCCEGRAAAPLHVCIAVRSPALPAEGGRPLPCGRKRSCRLPARC